MGWLDMFLWLLWILCAVVTCGIIAFLVFAIGMALRMFWDLVIWRI
jgi:hypothetical protein